MKKQIFKRRLRLVFFAVYLIGFFWFLHANLFDTGQALGYIAGALLVGTVIGWVVSGFRLKNIFLRTFSADSVREGRPDEFPLLDGTELERLTLAWEALGFERRRDMAGNLDNPRGAPTFLRTFEHPAHDAVAEISQVFAPLKVMPFTCAVMSFWGERASVMEAAHRLIPVAAAPPLAAPVGETPAPLPPEFVGELDFWVLVTHTRLPNKFWSLMRQRHIVSRRLERDSTPEQVWQAHLEQRENVETRLNQPHLCGDLEELLGAHSAVLSAQLYARLKRTPAWKFGVARLSFVPSPAHYDGELPA